MRTVCSVEGNEPLQMNCNQDLSTAYKINIQGLKRYNYHPYPYKGVSAKESGLREKEETENTKRAVNTHVKNTPPPRATPSAEL